MLRNLLLLLPICLSVTTCAYEVSNADLDRIAQAQRAREHTQLTQVTPDRMAALERKVAQENADKARSEQEIALIKAAWKKEEAAQLQKYLWNIEQRDKARAEYLKQQDKEFKKLSSKKQREKVEYPPKGIERSHIYIGPTGN